MIQCDRLAGHFPGTPTGQGSYHRAKADTLCVQRYRRERDPGIVGWNVLMALPDNIVFEKDTIPPCLFR